MRFVILVKCGEHMGPPPQQFIDAVEKAAAEAISTGKLIQRGGLAPSALSARVRVANGKITATDGPFTEAKEVVGGFGVVDAESLDEAVQGVKGLLALHAKYWPGWQGEAEVRPLIDKIPTPEHREARARAHA